MPKCDAQGNLKKTFKFITNCKIWRGFTIATDMGIEKRLNFLCKIVIILQWHEYKMCIM